MADQLTDLDVTVLLNARPFGNEVFAAHSALQNAGLLDSETALLTATGRAALAAYDAQKRREILRPALELLETIEAAVDRHTTSGGTAQSRPVIVAQATIDAIRDLLAKEAP